MKHRIIACQFLMFAAVLVFASGCVTTEFRKIQADFNTAAQADNMHAVSAVGLFAPQAGTYDRVLAALSDDLIRRLDDRLKGSAYAIRAIAQWRTGQFAEAQRTAEFALNTDNVPTLGDRDKVLLNLMKALAIDGDLNKRFQKLPRKDNGDMILPDATYQSEYRKNFRLAVSEIDKILSETAGSTPPEIMDYARFQKWRILHNWRIVAMRISGDKRQELRNAAASAEGTGLQKSLEDAINIAKQEAEDSPLFKVMQLLKR
jgi:tetratricopeptide (TPR) repeat protein